jgi:GntR family transcriptional repressor for pyruvate dehydrogenase complex
MTSATFQNVGSKSRLVDRVVSEIQKQIIDGKLTPGMMLPPERELTEQLGVSRTALREAIRMLVSKGLLETRPGIGTIVKKIGGDQIAEPLSMILEQTGGINLDHISQVRYILEVEIAGVAAREATADDLERIEAILQSLSLEKDDHEKFNRLDAEFHSALAKASHNPLLAVLLDSIRGLMDSVRQMIQNYPNLPDVVIPDHRNIFECIKSQDPEGAREAMHEHLEHARRIQEEYLVHQDALKS